MDSAIKNDYKSFVVEPYSEEFIKELLDECKAYSELQLAKMMQYSVFQITQHDMIVYFLKKAAKSIASVLILQPQKGRIKVLKLGTKQDQWDFVKTHVVNDLNNIHLFVTNQKG